MNSRFSIQTVSSQTGNIVSSQVRREVSQDRARTSNIKGGSCNKKWTELIRSESGMTMTTISETDLGQRTSTRKTKKIIKNKPQENSEAVKGKTPKQANMSAISEKISAFEARDAEAKNKCKASSETTTEAANMKTREQEENPTTRKKTFTPKKVKTNFGTIFPPP